MLPQAFEWTSSPPAPRLTGSKGDNRFWTAQSPKSSFSRVNASVQEDTSNPMLRVSVVAANGQLLSLHF